MLVLRVCITCLLLALLPQKLLNLGLVSASIRKGRGYHIFFTHGTASRAISEHVEQCVSRRSPPASPGLAHCRRRLRREP